MPELKDTLTCSMIRPYIIPSLPLLGLMTFVAFIICGIIPITVYLFVDMNSSSGETNFYISIALTAIALFGLGVLKVNVLTNIKNLR